MAYYLLGAVAAMLFVLCAVGIVRGGLKSTATSPPRPNDMSVHNKGRGAGHISRLGGGATAPGIGAPTLNYPSPLAANPTTIGVHIPVDWQSGDTLNLARSASVNMTSPTVLTHAITDADITAGTLSIGLSGVTLSGITYFDAYGTHSGVQSLNVSNIVTWGDTTAPTITTAATASVVETLPLAITLAATDTGGVPAQLSDGTKPGWCITGGADQLQFQIAFPSGTPTLQWYGNGSQSYSSPKNYPPVSANPYNVTIAAIDYGGNKSTLAEAVTVTQANLTPSAFSWTNQSGDPLSTVETAANTWTVAGMTAGVNASLSNVGGQIRVSLDSGVTWTAWGSPPSTVQNGAQIQARVTSSSSYSTTVTNAVTVGTATNTFSVTTMADPNAAGFTPSTNQTAAINNAYGSAVWTFSGIDFVVGGKPVVFLFAHDSNTFSSVVVKGAGASGADISLTQRLTNSAGQPMQVWTSDTAIVTGASQNVVVTATGSASYVGISTGTLTNASSSVPSATGVANFGATSGGHVATPAIIVPASGVGAGFFGLNSTGTYTAATGSLLSTKTNGMDNGTNAAIIGQTSSGSWTPQVNYTGLDAANGGLSCAWSH